MKINQAGWIKLYRRLLIDELWQDRPFARGQAWLDLLLLYNNQSQKLVISQRELARRWGWSVSKVSYFLRQLAADHHLRQSCQQKKTTIYLDSYDYFQRQLYNKKTGASVSPRHSPGAIKKQERKEITDQELWSFWERQL